MAHYEPLWPIVGPMLLPAIRRGGTSVEEVCEALATDMAQLWIAHQGEAVHMALVTQVGEGECHLWLLGGKKRHRWLHLIEDLKAAARAIGCRKLTLGGRKGWRRVFPDWRVTGDGLEIDI